MESQATKTAIHLYEKIVENISSQILKGILKPGEQIPSVRKLSKDLGVSVSTVLQSYAELEHLGLIEAKPQSGYFVRLPLQRVLPETEIVNKEAVVCRYDSTEPISNVHEFSKISNIVSLGAGTPSADILPVKQLNTILGRISRTCGATNVTFEFPPGNYKLRTEIAKLSIDIGCKFSPEDIITTTGALEATLLSLKATTNPGDTVITESPTYYLLLELIKDLGLNILEVPTHPRYGISLESLEQALKNYKVSACILYPSINNPLGSIMPSHQRKKLYDLLVAKNIPLIEGDVYGELYFSKREQAVKSLDTEGIVLYVSSFSKTVAPGYRVGWVCPGKYLEKVRKLKITYSLASPTVPQLVLTEFLKTGGYDKFIRNLRKIYSSRVSLVSNFICEYFPDGTRFTRPQGGYYLWIELPKSVDSVKLQRLALEKNISIAPGSMFSTKGDFINYIRLSCALPTWSVPNIKNAIKVLGDMCRNLM